VEIGNEDFFDHSGSYDARFAQFYDAIRKAYPTIKLIATDQVTSRTPDVLDQHFYHAPQWFMDNAGYYDSYDRSGPKIFVGEYAAQESDQDIGQGPATLGNALGEAAWITGLERNADVVIMAAYAPLFDNENDAHWTPDLIGFDALHSYGSPSYYVQQLFSTNHGDRVVPTSLGGAAGLFTVASKDSSSGALYLTVVNSTSTARPTRIAIDGVARVAPAGTATVLTSGSLDDQNSLDAPTKVAPRTVPLGGLSRSFTFTFQPRSVTVLRIGAA
jgi:alpha-L-arabinofuranosidase